MQKLKYSTVLDWSSLEDLDTKSWLCTKIQHHMHVFFKTYNDIKCKNLSLQPFKIGLKIIFETNNNNWKMDLSLHSGFEMWDTTGTEPKSRKLANDSRDSGPLQLWSRSVWSPLHFLLLYLYINLSQFSSHSNSQFVCVCVCVCGVFIC